MFKKRKNSFKKSMAILVCVAFISVVLPEVTHAATTPSSTKFPSAKKSFSLFSLVFSFANLNSPLAVYDFVTLYILSNTQGKPHHKPVNNPGNKTSKKDDGNFKNHGNSTAKKKPKGKD